MGSSHGNNRAPRRVNELDGLLFEAPDAQLSANNLVLI